MDTSFGYMKLHALHTYQKCIKMIQCKIILDESPIWQFSFYDKGGKQDRQSEIYININELV